MTITTISAILGTLISSGLLAFKIYETRRDRLKLHSTLSLNAGEPDVNVIAITNIYKNPITIDYLELFWAKNIKDETTYRTIRTRFDQECLIVIPAHGTREVKFSEEDYFGIHSDRGNLYIRINVAGQKKCFINTLYSAK